MATNQINKYIWFVETIYKAKRITLEELRKKWRECELSDGMELPQRTFHKWRVAVEEIFGLIIDCERKGGYHYTIVNADDLKEGNIRNWLINTFSISNLLIDNLQLKDRIILENIPSGQEHLPIIIEAMKHNKVINMTYHSYWRNKSSNFDVEPYCIKLFKQRWYVLGRSSYLNKMMIYALDRIQELWTLDDKYFNLESDFDADNFFCDYFGVMIDHNTPKEHIKLKVAISQTNYLRSLPLHKSQTETYQSENFSIFEYNMRPTSDFHQEIMWHGETIEVIEPKWLREEIISKINELNNIYKIK